MITFIIVLAALAVFYGLFWHDQPAETHRKPSTNPQPGINRNEVSAEASPSPPSRRGEAARRLGVERAGLPSIGSAAEGERRPFTHLRVNAITAGPQRRLPRKEKILHEPIHHFNEIP